MNHSRITGWGKYIPEKCLSNLDIEKFVNTGHDWIVSRTGIEQRYIANDDENCSMMAVKAIEKSLEQANRSASDLDLIIVATNTPDYLVPSVSSIIQHNLGANCPAFTVVTGCTGFMYALITAHQFLATGAYSCISIVGVDTISRFLDWNDRTTCVLFGDGAGAVVLEATNKPYGIISFDMGSDGAKGMQLAIPGFGSAVKMDHAMLNRGDQFLSMVGSDIFKFATRIVPPTIRKIVDAADLVLNDIALFVPHQANIRIIESATKELVIDKEKIFSNIHHYGNTSAASIPLCLIDIVAQKRVNIGDYLCLVSFGAGLTWASAIVRWGTHLD